jgi:hypothetical protein
MQKTLYIGLDVHKASISVTVAEEGRDGLVTFMGAIPNSPVAVTKLAKRLARGSHRLEFCYEAGCCGYVRSDPAWGMDAQWPPRRWFRANLANGSRRTGATRRSSRYRTDRAN